MKAFLISTIFFLVIPNAQAAQLKGGYWACISEEMFDEVTMAEYKGDKNAVHYLSKNGCVITKAGIEISILDAGWGTTKVRAYSGDTAVILWTNTENIQR
jgi:uncharacterized membrane protein